jgi:hypothetical protein
VEDWSQLESFSFGDNPALADERFRVVERIEGADEG